jgi:phosphoglycolate phosphatase
MKYGILFDLDGTLLDTLEDLKDSVNYALAQYGCPLRTREQVREAIGNGARKLIERSLPGKENDPSVDEVLATYQAYYATHNQVKTAPYKGIPEALAKIGEKYPIAIVSNKHDSAVKPLCESYFGSHIYALGEVAGCPRKPAPDMLYKGRDAIGVDTFIYVGDSEVDVVTAKNAGVKCLSVLWGFRDEAAIRANGGEYFCDDPAKLPEMLESMM